VALQAALFYLLGVLFHLLGVLYHRQGAWQLNQQVALFHQWLSL
jgi:hypothetical protein